MAKLTAYAKVCGVLDNKDVHIPLGVLYIYNLPIEKLALYAIESELNSSRGWRWLDLPMLSSYTYCGDFLEKLKFLIRYKFISATFKVIQLQFPTASFPVAVIRIYLLASDGPSMRFVRDWQSTMPKSYNINRLMQHNLKSVLQHLDFSPSAWEGLPKFCQLTRFLALPKVLVPFDDESEHANLDSIAFHVQRMMSNEPYMSAQIDKKPLSDRLQEIYRNIKSPDISMFKNNNANYKNVPTAEDVLTALSNGIKGVNVPGLVTDLYPFQVASLADMYRKETLLEKAPMSTHINVQAADLSRFYYFDLLSYRAHNEPEYFLLPKGGILAENMGLGKTIISIALICLTKYEVSQKPENLMLYDDDIDNPDSCSIIGPPGEKKLKRLTELCRNQINQNSLPWNYYSDRLPSSVCEELTNNPGYFRLSLDHFQEVSKYSLRVREVSARRKFLEQSLPEEGRVYRTLLLCNTTLVVVPDNLFHQWIHELKTHSDPLFLKTLFVANKFSKKHQKNHSIYTNVLPEDPLDLIKFDLVLLSSNILAKQFDESAGNVLLKIFWKRLLIDEGHSLSSKISRVSLMCRDIHSERRWCVTGTPTSGLTSLHMDEDDATMAIPASPRKKKYIAQSKFDAKDDLSKLGTIVCNFLKIEPFYSQPKLWNSIIVEPMISNKISANIGLRSLLNSIMVRHNLSEIEQDLKLPRLHHEPVFLKPSYHNKLSINLFTAVLAVNAVSSERTDVDYMFHPSNRNQLRRLILNLQRATFHWTGFKQEDIEALIYICNTCLKKHYSNGGRVYSKYDTNLLQKSVEVSKTALSNSQWRMSALLHEMTYYVSNLPEIFTKNFGIGSGGAEYSGVFGAPHLYAIQEFFYKNRFIDMADQLGFESKLVSSAKDFWSSYWEDTVKKNLKKFNKQEKTELSTISGDQVTRAVEVPTLKYTNDQKSERLLVSPSKSKSTYTEDINVKEKIATDENGVPAKFEINPEVPQKLDYQAIRNALILGTASAKLSYLGASLLDNQKKSIKSIVFFEFEDSAYYLTELLDILGVNYILYATFISPAERAGNLAEFGDYSSEEDGGITLIMDLRLAAHGLTILAATKVYFISPVWQRSIEAQAIKRAHRIGQKNEIFVETLVLKGTLEEEIYKKRSNEEELTKMEKKYLIDDSGMQEFVLKHRFLEHEEAETEFEPFQIDAERRLSNEHGPIKIKDAYTVDDDVIDNDDEYSLPDHKHKTSDVYNGVRKHWTAFLFSKDNLTKQSKVKNQSVRKAYLEEKNEMDLVSQKVRWSEKRPMIFQKEKPKDSKRVRF